MNEKRYFTTSVSVQLKKNCTLAEIIINGNFCGFHRVALSSTLSRSNWNLGFGWILWREEKRSTPRKTLGAGTRTNNKLNPFMTPSLAWESNPGHIGGRRVLSPLRHPCSRNNL